MTAETDQTAQVGGTAMNVLVTGGAGYIGSVIVEALLQRGHRVTVLDSLYKGHREAVTPPARLLEVDLGERAAVGQALSAAGAEAVIHMAADSLVGESMQRPLKYFRNNVINSLNLAEAVAGGGRRDPGLLLHGGGVRGAAGGAHHRRRSRWPPRTSTGSPSWPSSASCAGWSSFRACAGSRCATSTPRGPRRAWGRTTTRSSHLIPNVLAVPLGKRERVPLFGTDYPTPDGTCIRDYVHVADLAEAHILALEALQRRSAPGGAYNLGSGTGYSNREVIEAARRVTGHPIPVVEEPRRAGDPAALVASSERITAALGWRPRFPGIEEIVGSAWEWHRRHPDGYRSR